MTGDDSSVSKALQSFHFLDEEFETGVGFFGVRSYESSTYEGSSIHQQEDEYEVNETDSSDDEPVNLANS